MEQMQSTFCKRDERWDWSEFDSLLCCQKPVGNLALLCLSILSITHSSIKILPYVSLSFSLYFNQIGFSPWGFLQFWSLCFYSVCHKYSQATLLLFHTSYSLNLYCLLAFLQGLHMNWLLPCSQELPWVQHEGTSLALPLAPGCNSPSSSVCRSELTAQPNHEVWVPRSAGALTHCSASAGKTQFPTALFPIHHHGFVASSVSPQTQLTFRTENGATAHFSRDQFSSPRRCHWPFSSTPTRCRLPLTRFYFLL